MDYLLDYLPQLHNLYNDYYTPYSPYIYIAKRYLLFTQSIFLSYVYPVLYPLYRVGLALLSPLLNASDETPTLSSIVVLVVVAYISIKVLDIVRRQIISFIAFVIRTILWIAIIVVGIYVYNRGVEESFGDLMALIEMFSGLEKEGERKGRRMAGQKRKQAESARRRTQW